MNPNVYNITSMVGVLLIAGGVCDLYGPAWAAVVGGGVVIGLNLITLAVFVSSKG